MAGKRGDRPCELSAALVEAAESRGVVVLRHFISCTTFSSQDPVAVVRTLAFQLFWAFSEELAKVFTALCGKEEPFNCFSDMQEALEELLAKPVSKLPSDLGCPLLVVVDSLEAAGSTHQSNRMIRLVQMLPKALGRKAKILVTSAGSDSFLATSLGPLNPMKVPMTDCKAAGAPVVGMAGRLGLTGDADDSCGIEAMYTKYLEAKGAEPAKLASVLEPLLAAREPLTVEQLHRCGVPDTTGALQTLSGLFTLVTGGGGADGTENCVWATDPSVLDFFRAQGPWHVDETSGHRSIYDMLLQDLHSPEEDGGCNPAGLPAGLRHPESPPIFPHSPRDFTRLPFFFPYSPAAMD